MKRIVDHVVIGQGSVGLAIARQLSMSGKQVLVLGTKVHASWGSFKTCAVAHSGVYGPAGSLRAQLCMEGRKALDVYCNANRIHYLSRGKLVLATDSSSEGVINELYKTAQTNNIPGIQLLSQSDLGQIEPNIRCQAALLSSTTAVFDAGRVIDQFKEDAINHGTIVLSEAYATHGTISEDQILIQIINNQGNEEIGCKTLINAAGLYSQTMSDNFFEKDTMFEPAMLYKKALYFRYKDTNSPIGRLIDVISGIGAVPETQGQLFFGPFFTNAESIDDDASEVSADDMSKIRASIRKYYPQLQDQDLTPVFGGILPYLRESFMKNSDFSIKEEKRSGSARFINLYGTESAGLTASMSIAEYVIRAIEKDIPEINALNYKQISV